MNMTIFGATTDIGFEIAKQAIYKDIDVIAFDRNTISRNFPDSTRIKTISANLFDGGKLEEAIRNADVVVFALAPSSLEYNNSRSLGIKKLIEVLNNQLIKRLIVVSDASVIQNEDGKLMIDIIKYKEQNIELGDEYLKVKKLLEETELRWTILCSNELVVAAPDGNFSELKQSSFEDLGITGTGNMAMAVINAANKEEYVNEVVLIKNK